MQISPSILSADFADLEASVAPVAAVADRLHFDVMDGHFVPNLTFGPPLIAAMRARFDSYFDTHLMVTNPGELLEAYVQAGASGVTFHIEVGDPEPVIAQARALGVDVGLSLNPDTPIEDVLPYLGRIDTLLVMSVFPGFSGQSFIADVLDKVRTARKEITANGFSTHIEIDGGINAETAGAAGAAGVDIMVAGNAVFKAADPVAAVAELRRIGADARANAEEVTTGG